MTVTAYSIEFEYSLKPLAKQGILFALIPLWSTKTFDRKYQAPKFDTGKGFEANFILVSC